MSSFSIHGEWLSLIEISGPFLAVPVLKEAFPQGLEELDGLKRKRLRQAYDEWREAMETGDPQFPELHTAWINEVLARGLELDENGNGDTLKCGDKVPESLRVTLPEHGATLAPDLAVIDSSKGNKPLMLIHTYGVDVDLEGSIRQDGWVATPVERMVQLCRMTGCRIGLVTNGERWMLVDAPVGAVTSFASWYARIWGQEPITLQAFVHLLGIRRFFFDQSEQLQALFDRSLQYQDEVTEALGEQVRRAVEVLIQSLDKADQDRNRELLRDIAPSELYEAGLTVMMRLVFLLSAEERGLLLMGDECYEANYALSTLRMQLRSESEEILERRWDAWSRLLAIFRAVFGGIEHENLRLPALGGSLFDPDRFPFLEGRAKGTKWRIDIAKPLPIDNRTVMLLLEAIQQFQGRTLSYRALDVEQIGYVYEGLLERTVKRTSEVTLELDATKSAKKPWVTLGELESAKLDGSPQLAALLQERSGCSASRIRNDLGKAVDDTAADRLLTACQADTELRKRIKPYAHLLRTDPWGYPLVYPKDAFIVTTGSDRRETGTHYTPKSLTEAIIAETLTPIAYAGPAEGKPREEWVLKSPAELLDLKICDPAMGSGAFLVQACRWLSDRLVEAWSQSEANGQFVTVDGKVSAEVTDDEPLPRDTEARTVIARRLIAERCLYGVDLNPLAVELAKLSIWLVTLAKGRPFGFLDHNLRCGDSLLGIHRLDQLTELSMTPTGKGQQRLFGQNIEQAVHEAVELRQQLREMPIRDIHDVEAMARLDADIHCRLEVSERIADALIGEVFMAGTNGSATEIGLDSLAILAGQAVDGYPGAIKTVVDRAASKLSADLPSGKVSRRPFHWPLEFPEVFTFRLNGFDAIVGNPPFLGGQKITGLMGIAYRELLVQTIGKGRRGSADLVAYFFLRAFALLNRTGILTFVSTKTIGEGDTREVGLDQLMDDQGYICSVTSAYQWPGKAAVTVTIVSISKSKPSKYFIDNLEVAYIDSSLSNGSLMIRERHKLACNANLCSIGSYLQGVGFYLDQSLAKKILDENPACQDVIKPLVRGDDIINVWGSTFPLYGINFGGKTENEAKKYQAAYEIALNKVKPERLKGKDKKLAEYWWRYKRPTLELYREVKKYSQILVHGFTSKYVVFRFVSADSIFVAPLVVFQSDSYAFFALVQSVAHKCWVENVSSMASTLRYTPTDCFETFPLPLNYEDIFSIGKNYYELRESIMSNRQIGLTDLYNIFHNPKDSSEDIKALRELEINLDSSVLSTYGWNDFALEHSFYKTKQGIRFTVSEIARVEIIRRLSELNRLRHEEEVTQACQANKKTQISAKRGSCSKVNSAADLGGLFDESNE